MWSTHDLIVAPATSSGPGARGIVRLAGCGLSDLLATLLDASDGWPATGRPRVRAARLAAGGLARDWGPLPVTVLHWPGPGGPLGAPLAELQLPASAPLSDALVAAACRAGARLARGGEFTLRAFLAGRLDLVQAEAVLAVVDARSPDDLAAALDRLAGGAGGTLAATRDALLDLLADLEAAIDFADETTPDAVPAAPVWPLVHDRLAACAAAIAAGAAGLARRDAGAGALPRVVLAGPPNIGKSSLFNALVGRDAALVADAAGTTRDWLEAPLGAPDDGAARCTLVDVAGIAVGGPPSNAGSVEAAADARAREEVARADVVVGCADAGAPRVRPFAPACAIAVLTRADLAPAVEAGGALVTSSRTGAGIARLREAILAAVAALPDRGATATARLAAGLDHAATALAAALDAARAAVAGAAVDEAVVASDVRRAADALAAVTGATIDADLIDRIFSRHCIGK